VGLKPNHPSVSFSFIIGYLWYHFFTHKVQILYPEETVMQNILVISVTDWKSK